MFSVSGPREVESIFVQLPIAPSTYYEHKVWESDPNRRPDRARCRNSSAPPTKVGAAVPILSPPGGRM